MGSERAARRVRITSAGAERTARALSNLLCRRASLSVRRRFASAGKCSSRIFKVATLLNFSFRPHVEGVGGSRLFSVGSPSCCPGLSRSVDKGVGMGVVRRGCSRVGQVTCSVRAKGMSDSLLLKGLNSCTHGGEMTLTLERLNHVRGDVFVVSCVASDRLQQEVARKLGGARTVGTLTERLFFKQHKGFVRHSVHQRLRDTDTLGILVGTVDV